MGRLVDTSIDTPFFEGVLLAGGRSPYKAATHTHTWMFSFSSAPQSDPVGVCMSFCRVITWWMGRDCPGTGLQIHLPRLSLGVEGRAMLNGTLR